MAMHSLTRRHTTESKWVLRGCGPNRDLNAVWSRIVYQPTHHQPRPSSCRTKNPGDRACVTTDDRNGGLDQISLGITRGENRSCSGSAPRLI